MEKNSVYERVCRCLIAYDSIRAAFSAFDVNGDGDLEPREFLFVLAKLVPGLNEEAVGELMKNVKLDAQGNIGISEFVMSFGPGMIDILAQSHEHKVGLHTYSYSKDQVHLLVLTSEFLHERFGSLEDCFGHFDVFSHGRVSTQQFQRGLARLNIAMKGPVLDSLLRVVDNNADGFIAREEFASLYDINVGKPRAMSTTLDAIEEKLVEKFGSLEGAFGAFDTLSPHGRLTANEFIIGMLNIRDPTFGNRKRFEKLFKMIDRSRTGQITLDDWIQVLRHKNMSKCDCVKPRKREMDAMLKGDKHTKDRAMLCEDISKALRKKYDSLFNAFIATDKNRDGRISERELQDALCDVGMGVTEGQLRILITEATAYTGQRESFISYGEFLKMLEGNKEED